MRKLILLFVLASTIAIPCVGQNADVSLWNEISPGGNVEYVPWITFTAKSGLYLDLRYNFDWPGTSTLLVGKSFERGGATATASVGYIYGKDYKAPTFQVTTFWGGEDQNLYLLAQIATGRKEYPQFGFLLFQKRWSLNDRFSLGADGEIYKENNQELGIELGPSATFQFGGSGGMYSTVWLAFDKEGYAATSIGIGASF